ncbi:DNA polymerase zeta [Oleoguttula sp. CCFEE 5521]
MAKVADVFSVRLNCLDHYQNTPGPLDPQLWGPSSMSASQRGALPQVPVIRLFGATETGQKVCMHIHGAMPYLYVPYTESLEASHVEAYITTMRHSIDHAMALSYRRNPYDTLRNTSFVAHISLVKGVPFFGYNVGYHTYLKIYLLNPMHMTRFADLLQQGAILKRHFQPHEAHLQYLLQWMCDFNLYGCAYIETTRPYFRAPIPAWEEIDDLTHLWHDRSIKESQLLEEVHFPRQSHCQLEVDIRVEDILNRHEIKTRSLHHSFVERLSSLDDLPPDEKLVHSMAGLWRDETRRRKLRMGITDPSSSPFPAEVLVSMSADPRNDNKGGWIHEDEFREAIEELAQQERKARGGGNITFESFGSQQKGSAADVQTVLESVVDLFDESLRRDWAVNAQTQAHQQQSTQADVQQGVIIEPLVDMGSIAQVAEEDEYGSDEEIAKVIALTQRQKASILKRPSGNGGIKAAGDEMGDDSDATHEEDSVSNPATPHRYNGIRKRPAINGVHSPSKRQKVEGADDSGVARRVAFRVRDVKSQQAELTDGVSDILPKVTRKPVFLPPSGQAPRSSQHSSQGSHSSQQNRLDFAQVKDPFNPATQFRLSQRGKKPLPAENLLKTVPSKGPESVASQAFQAPAVSDLTPGKDSIRRKLPQSLANSYATSFPPLDDADVFLFGAMPLPVDEVQSSVSPAVIYQDAYYSNELDVPERAREYAGKEFRLDSTTLPYLPEFDASGRVAATKTVITEKPKQDLLAQRRGRQCGLRHWEIITAPPSWHEVQAWSNSNVVKKETDLDDLDNDGPPSSSQIKRKNRPAAELSQIDGPTQKNRHGAKYSQRKASTSVQHETGYMSTMALEVHVNSRADLAPDPERDEISMVVWSIADEQMEDESKLGILLVAKPGDDSIADRVRSVVGASVQVDEEDDELNLLNRMVDIVRLHDPDILTGYEVHNSSWGYLIERARLQYEFNLPDEFSRMKAQSHGRFGKEADRWGFNQTSTVRITGRHTINIWRAMRSELNLLQYTMENVAFHVLHRRVPHYAFAKLTRWYNSDKPKDLARVLDYFVSRTRLDLEILDANELIPRTSEQARLLGVDFFSVFSRGSQFKVESLMFRIAKPESFVLVSPSRKQVGAQNALECLPLVMEPMSAFYNSPLLVLDFQSLYPSVMIAYNYCYSTCLGRITSWRGTNKMGFADFKRSPGLLELVKDKVNIAPNGMMYVKPEMRKSLLAKMLGEILETRVMVKSGMKVDKDDKTLQQLLNNRQLALKLIANVTYGYTSASFSGRMPCSEIADSIVQTGRETLEKAIALIHSVEQWGAEVVYGDTDSLFVYLKGRTKADAFRIGDEIAKAVTDLNPRPVKLKFEKVYHPCVLLAKKRYVGFKYESPSQVEPDFDAKGIETVRRDGTPAEQKMEEKALKLLFRTADLSQVKSYFQSQCAKIMTGRFSVQDFCFAKEVKLGTYANKGPAPPGALIATKRMLKDPRLELQYGERVPYVVIAGAPGARLWERCVEPERLLHDEHAELDAEYYINKNLIPPLERIFNLVGANVRQWFDEMPKIQRIRMLGGPVMKEGEAAASKKKTMESYMGSSLCVVCRDRLPPIVPNAASTAVILPLCHGCRTERTQETILALRREVNKADEKNRSLEEVCRSCAGLTFEEEVHCDSRDCPVFYSRVKAKTRRGVVANGVGRVLAALEEEAGTAAACEW